MYTAIQARNIAAEKANHVFYRYYKRNVRRVMSQITKCADAGYMYARVYAEGKSRVEINTLKQIGEELTSYGYGYKVANEKDDKGRVYWFIEVTWQ